MIKAASATPVEAVCFPYGQHGRVREDSNLQLSSYLLLMWGRAGLGQNGLSDDEQLNNPIQTRLGGVSISSYSR